MRFPVNDPHAQLLDDDDDDDDDDKDDDDEDDEDDENEDDDKDDDDDYDVLLLLLLLLEAGVVNVIGIHQDGNDTISGEDGGLYGFPSIVRAEPNSSC